ncbi:hypothetical protein BDY19DRAFT_1050892 [Irpex rosettiformis]|uniref:Uncharacterized protein n=1 Tax=Irpex rosettiformis TaxID=378272 RepID=A0ACB8TSD6_9APHY|nr:hypothetical protein BDY19DRAFT_1050892 [Irpex rosettiformis]
MANAPKREISAHTLPYQAIVTPQRQATHRVISLTHSLGPGDCNNIILCLLSAPSNVPAGHGYYYHCDGNKNLPVLFQSLSVLSSVTFHFRRVLIYYARTRGLLVDHIAEAHGHDLPTLVKKIGPRRGSEEAESAIPCIWVVIAGFDPRTQEIHNLARLRTSFV